MLEAVILGIVQGITEWFPVSSEGILVLVQANFFPEKSFIEMVRLALFLHIGTFFAALIYFREDVLRLLMALVRYRHAQQETQAMLKFLFITSLISGVIGVFLFSSLEAIVGSAGFRTQVITGGIGVLLVGTAVLQLKAKGGGYKKAREVKYADSVLLGIVQGLAALPGLSRSGLTISALLLRKFDELHALRLSFLMSIPAVLGANIILNLENATISFQALLGIFVSFIFGILTIHLLLTFAKKVNFGYFVLLFGIVTIFSAFI